MDKIQLFKLGVTSNFLLSFTFNRGSEADNEISGIGNSLTTHFRELDTRLGRWWGLDPVFQPWQSPYCSMDNSPIYHNDVLGDDTDKDPKPKSKKSVNNKSKPKKSAHKEEDWRNKYFGPLLELQTNASSWASEQSNKMTEAVHQVDAIMKPLKDEKIKELKVLYKIQAELGGSGMASGLPLAAGLKLEKSVPKVLGKGYKAVGEVTVPIKNTQLLKKLNIESKGDWVKVYEAGINKGEKMEIHYFRNNLNGKVFDVKIKYPKWHQKQFKNL